MTHEEELEEAYATGVRDGFKQGQVYALEQAAREIYNAEPDPEFPERQTFYNDGVSPWLEQRALRVRYPEWLWNDEESGALSE